MKQLEFLYQDAQIHFLLNGTEAGIMINATEMAKAFSKETRVFLKAGHVKSFISELKRVQGNGKQGVICAPNGAQIIQDRGRNGMYFCEELALKFAAWLSPEFEVWVYRQIKELTFGNYRKHWDAHMAEEKAKKEMATLKRQLLTEPTAELAEEYFLAEQRRDAAKNLKHKSMRAQLKLFS